MTGREEVPGSGSGWLRRVLSRSIVLGILWWVLGGSDPLWWWVGLPAVGLAVMVSLSLAPASMQQRWRARGVVLFVPFFCFQSLRGGIDVARRAFDPRLPLHPSLVRYPFRLMDWPSRVFMANAVSLLPGTLSADLDEHHLLVHALDQDLPVMAQLHALETRVAHLFCVALPKR